jgi:GT2 family glycosyltransferase
MYLEDIDLTRRMHRIARNIYFPGAVVQHGYKKESYSNPKLFANHIASAIRYFNKWGWFFDKERERENEKVMQQLL